MIVCHCFSVNDRLIRGVIAEGASTVEQVAESCEAGGLCGGCHPAICRLLGAHPVGTCGGDECAVSSPYALFHQTATA